MRDVMNIANNNNNSGRYPLFLGSDLGFSDEINVTYPELVKIRDKQQSMFWLPSEFHFNQDRIDLMEAPESERDVMVLNLLAQHLMDSVASRSIIEIFGSVVTNTELHDWFLTQSFFEQIHASTYSKILRNCFSDGNSVLERGKNNLEVFNRCKRIGQVFNELNEAVYKWHLGQINDEKYMKSAILKGVFTLYCLEQVSFNASFASTFALAETGRYQTIGKAVSSIANDELVHAEGDRIVLDIMLSSNDYKAIYENNKAEYQSILDDVLMQEVRWSDYIFSEGRKALGLNSSLLKEYVAHVSSPIYEGLELVYPESKLCKASKSSPLSYMEKYLDRDAMQPAAQEILLNNYRVGQVVNDFDDSSFDIDF